MRWCVVVLAVGAVACGDNALPAADAQPAPDAQPLPDSVDILFVFGTSLGTQAQQDSIINAFPSLIATLEDELGGRPSLHIGVISANLGVGDNDVFSCTASGDDAALQATPTLFGCTPPSEAFIRDELGDAGGRAINYPDGMVSETFACIASLGDRAACAFEQPLEAMRRALDDNPANIGFRRDGASLAVIIFADEDDCSVADEGLFDPSQTELDSELGPLSGFRCFDFGVKCEPDSRLELGPRENCRPEPDPRYHHDVDRYLDFLGQIVLPERLTVASFHGPIAPVIVADWGLDDRRFLEPSCTGLGGGATPGIRLHTLVRALGERGIERAPCEQDQSAEMARIGEKIAATLQR